MRALGLVVVFVLAGCSGTMPDGHSHPDPAAKPLRCRPPRQTVVDLSHRLHPAMAVLPGESPFEPTARAPDPSGRRAHDLKLGAGTGTHLDAPSHFPPGERSVHAIPVDELVAPVVVIDVRPKTEHDPDYVVGGNDVVDWEAIHGPVPVGSVVVFHTGWHARFEQPASYLNQDAEGVMHFPGLSAEAARLLVERDVVGIGIDTPSVDPGTSQDFAAHQIVLAAGKYQLENLDNLEALPETGATIIVGVLPVLDGTQGPARVLALVPEKKTEDE